MPLIAGTLDANGNFVETDSLGKSIDTALASPSAFGQLERRQLLIAIATGIIQYFKNHQADFKITVTISGTIYNGTLTIQ